MQRLTVEPITEGLPLTRSRAEPVDPARVLRGDVLIEDADGRPVAVQLLLDDSVAADRLTWALQRIEWDWPRSTPGRNTGEYRLSGIASSQQVFGTVAPQVLRQRYGCLTSSFSRKHPRVYGALQALGRDAWARFAQTLPEQAQDHAERITSRIRADWCLDGLPYTSGIINNCAALPYHRDASNVGGTWSLMVALRRGMGGGALHIPGYGVWLAVEDRSVIVFDGQAHLHGVTPLIRQGPHSYRYTIVYYAKAGCAACGPKADEVRRAAAAATAHYERVAHER